jgi:redox-sensing transcriptional repressor
MYNVVAMKKQPKNVSENMLQRLPLYLSVARKLKNEGVNYINAPKIAEITNLNQETIKKDLSIICKTPGNPRLGRKTDKLIRDLISFGVFTQVTNAILIGTGKLGTALLSYEGFPEWGLNFVAGFDVDDEIVGKRINGIPVYHVRLLQNIVEQEKPEIAVITVPKEEAQEVVDMVVASGIPAIWNFASTHVQVPKETILYNEYMASSLALINYNLYLKSSNKKK